MSGYIKRCNKAQGMDDKDIERKHCAGQVSYVVAFNFSLAITLSYEGFTQPTFQYFEKHTCSMSTQPTLQMTFGIETECWIVYDRKFVRYLKEELG